MISSGMTRAVGSCIGALASLVLTICDARADTGPHLVRDINQVRIPESSNPQYLGSLNGRVLFGATDRAGSGLWSTDGTSGGTQLISRIDVFAQRDFPGSPLFIVQGGLGFFAGDDASTGVLELWVTDGTSQGTVRLTTHAPSATSYSGFSDFIGVLHGRVIFYSTDATGVMQVWSTDGTPAGTLQLSQLQGSVFGGGGGARSPSLMLSDRFYFVAGILFGIQLWVSDGTPQGTQVVQSSALSNATSIQSPVTVGNLPMFGANGLLWAIDPASETVFAVSAAAPPGYSNQPPVGGAVLGGVVSLDGAAISAGHNMTLTDTELWRSDGSVAGTYLLAVIASGQIIDPRIANFIVTVNGHALTVGSSTSGGFELFSTDGTVAGTGPVLNLPAPPDSVTPVLIPFGVLDGLFFFAVPDGTGGQNWAIWSSDGTIAGTRQTSLPDTSVSQIGGTRLLAVGSNVFVVPGSSDESRPLLLYNPAANSTSTVEGALATPYYVSWVAGGGHLYFSVDDPKVGNEPWVSNGTASGTQLIRDINPEWSDYPSNPDQLVNFAGRLAFVADDGVHGTELWISDGTLHGTHLLADVNPGPAGSNPTELTVRGRNLFFFATDASGMQRLMRLHAGKTHPNVLSSLSSPPSAQPPYYFPPPCYPNVMQPVGRRLYLAANDGNTGVELWTTNGTPAGTGQVADIYPGSSSSNPCALTALDPWLYFSATTATDTDLYLTDGTAAGTQLVQLAPGNPSSYPSGLTAWHGSVYFDLVDGTHGAQIWRSSGAASMASLFVDLAPGNLNAYGQPAGTLPHYLLLSADLPDASGFNYTQSLWSSDGTPGKAVLLAPSFVTGPLTLERQALFFVNEPQGIEPWVTDGTAAGTLALSDISPDAGTFIDWQVKFGPGAAFATHDGGVAGDVLWRTDGTAAGTARVGSIPTAVILNPFDNTLQLGVGSNLFFVASTPSTGNELWVYTYCFPRPASWSVATSDSRCRGTH